VAEMAGLMEAIAIFNVDVMRGLSFALAAAHRFA
jgi:hypothetical protein